MTRRGFTLIELLIVVAIIAILAAIAVPNFLEAQTRSRVSRAQNDLRTIALGMESYRVDNNGYPAGQNASPLQPTAARDELDLRLLTTPLSYIASVPGDIFRLVAGRDVEAHLGYIVPGQYRVYGVSYPTARRSYSVYPKTAWMTWSIGPDLLTNCGGYRCYQAVTDNEGGTDSRAPGQPPGIGVDKNGNWITSHTGDYWGMRYDPTNGTVSYGDIYRFEGEAITRPNV